MGRHDRDCRSSGTIKFKFFPKARRRKGKPENDVKAAQK